MSNHLKVLQLVFRPDSLYIARHHRDYSARCLRLMICLCDRVGSAMPFAALNECLEILATPTSTNIKATQRAQIRSCLECLRLTVICVKEQQQQLLPQQQQQQQESGEGTVQLNLPSQ